MEDKRAIDDTLDRAGHDRIALCVETARCLQVFPDGRGVGRARRAIRIFGKSITSIYIKSADVAKSFMEYFNILWQQGKE